MISKSFRKFKVKYSTTHHSGSIKGYLSQAYIICTEKYLQSEINILIDIFTENGHNRNTLTNIATDYLQNISRPKSND